MNEQSSPPVLNSMPEVLATPAPSARTHNAARFADEIYWAGHATAAVLLIIAVVFIVAGRGPRRRDALASTLPSIDSAPAGVTPVGGHSSERT
jgi:hypothetical protein